MSLLNQIPTCPYLGRFHPCSSYSKHSFGHNSDVQFQCSMIRNIHGNNQTITLNRRYFSDEKDKPFEKPASIENHSKESNPASASTSSSSSNKPPPSSRTAKAVNALGSATMHYTYEFNKLYTDLEKSMMSKINESNRRRIRIAIISILIGAIILVVVFGTVIRKGITDGTADIAKETLGNESLKIQTQELAMAVVQTILNDKDITSHAANFLREASTVSETQAALLQLTMHVLQHPESLNELQILVKKLLSLLAEDKEAIGYVSTIMSAAMKDKKFVDTLIALLNDLSLNPEIIRIASELSVSIVARPEVIKAFVDLLSQSSQEVLVDPQVIQQSREFVAEVVGDDKIQREGGDALWNSITHALRPGLIRLGGVVLVGVSIGLAQMLLSPY